MSEKIQFPKMSLLDTPPLAYRFGVTFLTLGIVPNLLDIRFQRVSGLSAEIATETVEEGGQNLYTHRLPGRISYGNLVLERGLAVGSPLAAEFNLAMSAYQFFPSNVIVLLLNEDFPPVPLAGWLFLQAYPVRWSVSDLDANSNQVVVETLELAYTRFQSMQL